MQSLLFVAIRKDGAQFSSRAYSLSCRSGFLFYLWNWKIYNKTKKIWKWNSEPVKNHWINWNKNVFSLKITETKNNSLRKSMEMCSLTTFFFKKISLFLLRTIAVNMFHCFMVWFCSLMYLSILCRRMLLYIVYCHCLLLNTWSYPIFRYEYGVRI